LVALHFTGFSRYALPVFKHHNENVGVHFLEPQHLL